MMALKNMQRLGALYARLLALFVLCAAVLPTAAAAQAVPKPKHVFIIVLENESRDTTFGANSPALYLNALARKGAYLENYYATGHYSLDNYIAMVSGQAPNPITQSDCPTYADFRPKDADGNGKLDQDGQALGQGCVYPKNVPTIVNQLEAKGLTWKGYMEDMGNDLTRDRTAACSHPEIDSKDGTQKAAKGDQYATRHDPFMYFHSVIDDHANCAAHVVNLSALAADLQSVATTPNYAFITPNLCHDGHDEPCVDDEPGGLLSADKFLQRYVPQILNSPAYKQDGLLIITFDEAEIRISQNELKGGDVSACCNEPMPPNIKPGAKVFGTVDDIGAGVAGPGGGRIGAVLLSRYIAEDTVSKVDYNHFSMLRSIEDFFGLDHLGYAGQKGLKTFGPDVFTQPSGNPY